jgi:hypothetical protein
LGRRVAWQTGSDDAMNESSEQAAIEAIEKHFSGLEIGQSATREHIHTEEEARSYAERYDVAYPGIYMSPDGKLLVPPGLIFMRPAVTFGISDPDAPPQSLGGIYTRAHRRYFQPVRVGQRVTFDGHIIDTFERRGFYYLTVRWDAKDDNGTLLAGGDEWHTLGFVRKNT